MKIKVEAGKTYFLCTCELSAKHPFCDGSHRGSGKKSIAYKAEKTCTIALVNNQDIVEV